MILRRGFFGVKWCCNKIFGGKKWLNNFFCFNAIKMRHLKNRSLEKCIILYQFVNLKLFHPEQRNFDRTSMRFLDTGISRIIFNTDILRFEMASFLNLAHAWFLALKMFSSGLYYKTIMIIIMIVSDAPNCGFITYDHNWRH
jgi:hypothetical protein